VCAKNSKKTTVGTLSNFNLLCGLYMLLPFLPPLRHYALPVMVSGKALGWYEHKFVDTQLT